MAAVGGAFDYEEYYVAGPDGEPVPRWRRREAAVAAPPSPDGHKGVGEVAHGVDWYFPKGLSAKRVAERLREETHFARGGGELHVYRDGVYAPDGKGYVQTRTTQLLEDRWTRRCAEEVAAFLLADSPRLWDRPPMDTVNVRNGLVDVNTCELREHTPEFLSPVQLGASYDPAAPCPCIDAFVGEVFPGDAEALAYELAGHLMIPDTSLERAVMLLGGGSNGKSTYLRVLHALLGGSANVSAVPLQALDTNRFAAANLYGMLANVVADLNAEAVRSSAMFKAIVGGDSITGERKYGTPFAFRPYARLLLSANEPPPTHDTTYAYFRRWLIVPFTATFIGSQRDKELAQKLTTPTELSGLLNRALEGLSRLREQGDFTQAGSLEDAAQEFRRAVDSAAGFVQEDCALGSELRIAKPGLYQASKEWCERVNRSPLSARRFNERVKTLLPNPDAAIVTINGTEHWQGITLASRAPNPVTVASDSPEEDQEEGEDDDEGGERVPKVANVPIPYSPGEEELKRVRVGRTATQQSATRRSSAQDAA